jgi:hypothetical protein
MNRKFLITLIAALTLSGCYTKKVEKVETAPERTVIRERPNVVIHDSPDVVRERSSTTVIER